jgi:hypothetical protein
VVITAGVGVRVIVLPVELQRGGHLAHDIDELLQLDTSLSERAVRPNRSPGAGYWRLYEQL